MSTPTAPPGPKHLLPSLYGYFRQPLAYYQKLLARHGQPFSVPFPLGGRMAVTGCPLHIGRIFKGGPGLYRSVDASAGMFYGEQSLLSLDGEAHARLRRALMAPVLRQPAQAAGLMRDAALRLGGERAPGTVFDMLDLGRSITLDVILRTVFGMIDALEQREFSAAIHGLQGTIGFMAVFVKGLRRDWGEWSPWGRFVRARARCYALIEARMAASRAAGESAEANVLAYWVGLRDEAGQPVLSDAQIRDNLLTLLFAGHDSTAVALAWCVYWTHREPGVLLALRDELRDYAETLDIGLLERTPYLDAVCWEALRMHPVAPGVARRLNRTLDLGERRVPEGDVVMACIDLVSHDPALYADPGCFRPERFLARDYSPTELIPFGGGERRCPGAALAFMELRVVLATLVAAFRWTLAEPGPVKPAWSHGIRRPATGVRMAVDGHRSQKSP
ncbi:Cytochrome P450 [Methylomagnum ishizawai]|uniref:Cytochrome P450 n=1 Tax=Methylomagnum ishizawai TaxID=1760988 RepID=A0A1Y6DDB8_9GAMM|nr:cytochrome P450 [Methylomagnum ishizawai]SMF97505.1 Cytochrome P450 [Methylomagnum ishizawai]